MKHHIIYLYLFMALPNCGLGQDSHDHFMLEGFVHDSHDNRPIKGVTIQLVRADAFTSEVLSDSMGYYRFTDLSKRISYTAIPIAGNAGISAPVTYGERPYSHVEDHGYMNGISLRINGSDTMRAILIHHDFKMRRNLFPSFLHPQLCFKFNSIEFLSPGCDSLSAEVVIDCMLAYFNAHPKYTFEIGGHADRKEKEPGQLSQKRAALLKDIFIKSGIDPERLTVKGYGSEIPSPLLGVYEEIIIPENSVSFEILRRE